MANPAENEENEVSADQQNNEELAKQIPTVTPDDDNLEPKADDEPDGK